MADIGSFGIGTAYIDIVPRIGPQFAAGINAAVGQAGASAGAAFEQNINRSTANVQTRMNQVFNLMSSLGGATSPLGNAFQNLFTNIETGFDRAATKAEQSRQRIGAALEGIGVAAVGLGALLGHFANPLEKAMADAETAIKNTGQPLDEFKGRFDSASKSASQFGFTQADTAEALARLTVATKDPNEALKELTFTETLAAAKHETLATAAESVSRAHAGNFRAFKEFGINITAVTNADAKAEAATKSYATALDNLKTAQQRLSDFEALIADRRAAAQDAFVQKVDAANQHVADSEQALADLTARIADQNAQAQEAYAQRVETANQRVIDSERAAADARDAGSDQVAQALQRLHDLQAVDAATGDPKLQAELQRQTRMRDAQQAVVSAREAAAKTNTRAAETVTKAQADQAKVVAAGPLPQSTIDSQNQQLAKAADAVTKAKDALLDVQAKGAGGPGLAALQEEKRLKDAVADAAAKETDAAKKEAKAKADAANSQAAFAKAEEEFMKREGGLLEARRKTWAGTLDSLKAKVENFFAGLGEKFAKPLETIGPGVLATGALLRLGRGARGASSVAGAAEGLLPAATADISGFGAIGGAAAAGAGGEAAAAGPLAGLAAAAGPVGLVAAAVAAVGVAAFEAYQHIKPFHDAVDAVGRAIKVGFGDAVDWLKHAWTDVIAPVFDGIRNVLEKVVGPAFTVFKDLVKLDFAIIVDTFKIPWETVIRPGFELMAAIIRDVVGPAFTWLSSHVIGPVFGAFESVVSKAWGVVKGVFDAVDKHIRGPLSSAFHFIGEVWDTVWGGVKKVVSTALHDIGVVIGKVIGVVATIAEHIPGAGDIGKALRGAQHDVEGLAWGGKVRPVGAGFRTDGPQAIVGEGDPAHPEYVIATDPKYRQRNLGLMAEAMGHFGMAGGGILGYIEDKATGVLSGAGNLASSVIGEIAKIGDIAKALAEKGATWVLEHGWPKLPVGNDLLGIVPASVNSLRQNALDFFGGSKGGSGSGALPGSGSPLGPPPAGNVTDWLKQAIALTGVPGSWLPGLYVIAMGESGGNPHDANNWDSNAKAGNPSEGLMQTTISTFRGNMLPGHGDIWNPVDNAAAAIRYILGRYHDISRVPGVASKAAGGPYKPYAIGGVLGDAITLHTRPFDGGGVLEPGLNLVPNNTGAREGLARVGADSPEIATLLRELIDAVREGKEIHVDGEKLGAVVDRSLHSIAYRGS